MRSVYYCCIEFAVRVFMNSRTAALKQRQGPIVALVYKKHRAADA
jgi:hypothetical protein